MKNLPPGISVKQSGDAESMNDLAERFHVGDARRAS